MDFSDPVTIWVTLGIVLMLAEIVLPGGIVFFIGLSALLTGGAWFVGLVDTWVYSLVTFFILTMVLILAFRNVSQSLFGGDQHIGNTDEDLDIYGKTATVIEPIGPGKQPGRIDFQGTQWPALSDGSEIPAGANVKIICHENISLLVELKQ
ncbi:NfeD family protein [Thalassotalea agarivorans]|uniref:NfeD-like C-terminal domain-containing protein n=1 Tax=Thalassotalea agarivorans TaxID=349064 RepID=A0A1I0B1M1_THASX|nr:NfeD family protein [Thalassotalea agarivorans]SET00633.1 hypothetical protein SAMN05660429_00894 [Thalassotalea agarivorans]